MGIMTDSLSQGDHESMVLALVELGRRIQREEPARWAKVPGGPMPPKKGMMDMVIWALKRYDADDPALRDMPYRELCKMGREDEGDEGESDPN